MSRCRSPAKSKPTEERYDPNGQVVRSEQRGQEKSSGVNGTSGGVPGVESSSRVAPKPKADKPSSNNNQTKNETFIMKSAEPCSRKTVEPTGTNC